MPRSQTVLVTSRMDELEHDEHARSRDGGNEVVACVIAVVVLAGVLVTMVLYYSFWPTEKAGTVPPASSYSEDSIVQRLRAIMAPDEDPCRDFYNFVCGNYKSSSNTTLLEMDEYMYQSLFRTLEDAAVPARGQSAAQKAAGLYKACLDIGTDEKAGLQEFVAHVGLSSTGYKGADAVDKILMLFFRHNLITLLRLRLEDNRLFRNKRELQITLSDTWLLWCRQRDDPGMSVAVYMETLDLPARDIVKAESKAFGLLSSDILGGYKHFSFSTVRRMETLTPNKTGERWTTLVETHTDGLYSGDDEVQVSKPAMQYLNSLYVVVGKERLSLLTAWELVRTLAPLTVPTVAHRYTKESLREVCLYAAHSAMEVPLFSWYLFPEVTSVAVGTAANMATHIRGTILEEIRNADWLDDDTKRTALHKVHVMGIHVGYPQYFNSTRAIDSVYRSYPDVAGSFLKPWLDAMNMTIAWLTTNHSSYRFSLESTNAAYSPMRNKITIPATILRNPIFSRTAPTAYNYGGLGHAVAHEMTHAFDRSGSRWDGSGGFRNWWSLDSRRKYEERIQCLRRAHSTKNATEDSENTADFGGLVSAYSAFLELDDREQLQQYAELGFGAEQLFFISACIKFCGQAYAETVKGYASLRNRCNIPLRNLDAFGEAFNCPVGSYMRPSPAKHCSFW